MTSIDLIALSTWPLIGLACWLIHKNKGITRRDPRRHIIDGIAGALLLVPFFCVMAFFRHDSALVVAMEYTLIAAIGAIILFAVWRSNRGPVESIIAATMGVFLLGLGVRNMVGDFALRHGQLEGTVSERRYEKQGGACVGSCNWDYFLVVRNKRYATTRAVFDEVTVGQRLRVDIGRASQRILSVESLPL